jgi:hypothetical protein
MSADLAPALALAEKYGIALDLVDGDRLHWRSPGPTPEAALEALKAAKGELIDLLVRYRLDSAGGLAGDDLLATLRVRGFAVRRYGVNAALDDALGGALQRAPTASLLYAFADRQAEYSLALRALGASNCLEGNCPQSGVPTTEDYAVLLHRPRLLTQTEQPRSSPSFQGTSPAERATARRAKLTPRWELATACMRWRRAPEAWPPPPPSE